MINTQELLSEAHDALHKVWFVQSLEILDRTDQTLSIRLVINSNLFVQAFFGEISRSLYFALISGRQRIFGIDRVAGAWHVHPFDAPNTHQVFVESVEPKSLLKFLSKVEALLMEHDLL